jgi:tripartite ATP-independent transporter DctM subunit
MFLGVPISFVLILSTVSYIISMGGDISWLLIPQRIVRGMDSFLLLSLPFFVLTGTLMNKGGITMRLTYFARVCVGHISGGLALVNVVVCAFFGAVSGTGVGATSAVGGIMIPAMKKEGYSAEFSAALTAVGSTMAPVIPPSIAFVLYGAASRVSIGDLFIGGVVPGLLMGVSLAVIVYFYAKRYNYPKLPRASWIERLRAAFQAGPSLLLPIFIFGGIAFGFVTPTEAAALAALYAFILTIFIYRTVSLKQMPRIFYESAVDTGTIMLLVGTCFAFGWALSNERVAFHVTEFLLAMEVDMWVKLLLINLALLLIGSFMDSAPAIMLITPILAPAMAMMGLHPVHAGLIVCMNLAIGLATPPVGVCLFAAANIGKVSFEKVVKASVPFLLAVLAVLVLVTYVPWFSLALLHFIRGM